MGVALANLTATNIREVCFPANKKRVSVGLLPHQEDNSWYPQIYDTNAIALPKEEIPKKISTHKPLIEDHVERRIQLFFQQSILCYNTPFIYDANGAEDQIGQGQSIKTGKTTHKTQAAHSSTFPCLYACLKKGNGEGDPKTRFVFLKHSSAYRQHNATVELPIYVNQTDTALDGKTYEGKLRTRSLTLLNRCAKGTLNPVKATRIFLSILKEETASLAKKYEETDPRRQVAKIYETQAKEIQRDVQSSDEIFDRIMGVNLQSQDNQEVPLRELVYRRRFALIQQTEFIQSQIAKNIFATQNQIFQTKIENIRGVDRKLRYALLKEFSGENLRSLEKLLCTSIPQLESKPTSKRNAQSDYAKLTLGEKKKIKSLAGDLRRLFRELQKEEWVFRSKLFKDLRQKLKEWKQSEFVDEFKASFSDEPMSQSMVSRLEQPTRVDSKTEYSTPIAQRRKYIDVSKARKIAETFGIDEGLFLPALFTSSDE
jgi:hypothetical protein